MANTFERLFIISPLFDFSISFLFFIFLFSAFFSCRIFLPLFCGFLPQDEHTHIPHLTQNTRGAERPPRRVQRSLPSVLLPRSLARFVGSFCDVATRIVAGGGAQLRRGGNEGGRGSGGTRGATCEAGDCGAKPEPRPGGPEFPVPVYGDRHGNAHVRNGIRSVRSQ